METDPLEAAGVLKPQPPGEIVTDIIKFVSRFVAFANHHQPIAVALWVIHTYVMAAAETTPYLQVSSPEKRSGKTRLLEAVELLVRSPWRVASPSEAVLFRKIAADEPTLLFDEYDTLFGDKSGAYEGVRAILNSGYRRGLPVPRCVGEGKNIGLKDFNVFCPKALSGIGRLPDTVADRSTPIQLKRRGGGETVERFVRRRVEPTAAPIRARLDRWAEKNIDALMDAEPLLPEALNDRAADGWEPLLAIADLIGGEWPGKARSAALALHGTDDEESIGALLLGHIKAAFEDRDRMLTADLLRALVAEEEGPWGEWWGAAVEKTETRGPASRLARLLKGFGVAPKTIRDGADRAKGYERSQFADAWNRYLTAPSRLPGEKTRDKVTPQVDPHKKQFSEQSKKAQNKATEQPCHVVTTKNDIETGQGEAERFTELGLEVVSVEETDPAAEQIGLLEDGVPF